MPELAPFLLSASETCQERLLAALLHRRTAAAYAPSTCGCLLQLSLAGARAVKCRAHLGVGASGSLYAQHRRCDQLHPVAPLGAGTPAQVGRPRGKAKSTSVLLQLSELTQQVITLRARMAELAGQNRNRTQGQLSQQCSAPTAPPETTTRTTLTSSSSVPTCNGAPEHPKCVDFRDVPSIQNLCAIIQVDGKMLSAQCPLVCGTCS